MGTSHSKEYYIRCLTYMRDITHNYSGCTRLLRAMGSDWVSCEAVKDFLVASIEAGPAHKPFTFALTQALVKIGIHGEYPRDVVDIIRQDLLLFCARTGSHKAFEFLSDPVLVAYVYGRVGEIPRQNLSLRTWSTWRKLLQNLCRPFTAKDLAFFLETQKLITDPCNETASDWVNVPSNEMIKVAIADPNGPRYISQLVTRVPHMTIAKVKNILLLSCAAGAKEVIETLVVLPQFTPELWDVFIDAIAVKKEPTVNLLVWALKLVPPTHVSTIVPVLVRVVSICTSLTVMTLYRHVEQVIPDATLQHLFKIAIDIPRQAALSDELFRRLEPHMDVKMLTMLAEKPQCHVMALALFDRLEKTVDTPTACSLFKSVVQWPHVHDIARRLYDPARFLPTATTAVPATFDEYLRFRQLGSPEALPPAPANPDTSSIFDGILPRTRDFAWCQWDPDYVGPWQPYNKRWDCVPIF